MPFDRDHLYNDEEDSDFQSHRRHSHYSGIPMPACPKCHSSHVETRNRARKLAGAIGAIAGSASTLLMAATKLRTASTLAGGPATIAVNSVVSAVIAGLASGAASGTVIPPFLSDAECRR